MSSQNLATEDGWKARIKELERQREEARSFARGVYRWGPRAQWGDWERLMPWLKETNG